MNERRVSGLGAMFAQFDRPDWDGSTDRSIDVIEFTQGLRSLHMDLTDQQIQDVFNMVDKNRECLCALLLSLSLYILGITRSWSYFSRLHSATTESQKTNLHVLTSANN
jgi:hypothetical protein